MDIQAQGMPSFADHKVNGPLVETQRVMNFTSLCGESVSEVLAWQGCFEGFVMGIVGTPSRSEELPNGLEKFC